MEDGGWIKKDVEMGWPVAAAVGCVHVNLLETRSDLKSGLGRLFGPRKIWLQSCIKFLTVMSDHKRRCYASHLEFYTRLSQPFDDPCPPWWPG